MWACCRVLLDMSERMREQPAMLARVRSQWERLEREIWAICKLVPANLA